MDERLARANGSEFLDLGGGRKEKIEEEEEEEGGLEISFVRDCD